MLNLKSHKYPELHVTSVLESQIYLFPSTTSHFQVTGLQVILTTTKVPLCVISVLNPKFHYI